MSIKHHLPKYLPIELNYGLFAKELAAAQYSIGLLQGSQGKLRNAMHLIGPLVAKEAAVSSKIEGTQSTSSDIYIYDAGGKPAHSDTPVVSNYRAAMIDAIYGIKQGHKLTAHLIKALHGTLLKEVNHKGKIGTFREAPVWIGKYEGDPIEKALYIPPEHFHVNSYVENILDYIEKDTNDMNLVKAGVIHYQFEAVHPFEDGNGRIGRLLIPLILFYKGDLSLPIVYSSGYFEARPDDYRNALRKVDQTGKYEPWLQFFFNAITEQAKETLTLIENIQSLNTEIKSKYELSKSPYMSRFLDYLFETPIFTIPAMQKKLSLGVRLTAVRLVTQLVEDKILDEVPHQKGPGGSKLYAFRRLLEIIR
jgi:Fic family protein